MGWGTAGKVLQAATIVRSEPQKEEAERGGWGLLPGRQCHRAAGSPTCVGVGVRRPQNGAALPKRRVLAGRVMGGCGGFV